MQQGIRRAVTLVEVIFAIGVILIGLLGLLSILPLAGKRSQDSVSLSTGPQIANRVLAELKSNQFLVNGQLAERLSSTQPVLFNQPLALPLKAEYLFPVFLDQFGYVVRQSFFHQVLTSNGISPPQVFSEFTQGLYTDLAGFYAKYPATDYPRLEPAITSAVANAKVIAQQQYLIRQGNFRGSYTLDPIYFADSIVLGGDSNGNNYEPWIFPFFTKTHAANLNPSISSAAATLRPWMYRVGIADAVGMIPRVAARLSGENRDDLINTRLDDRSLPVRLSDGEVMPITDGLEYGKRIPSGEFSWMVTVHPLPRPGYARVAVVVIRNRNFEYEMPENTSNVNQNLVGERMANVTEAFGFRGGAGGVLHLQANKLTSSKLIPGDWIMLSKSRLVPSYDPSQSYQTHHWYQVVGLDGEPESVDQNGNLDPNGRLWRHRVLLSGPDWDFTTDQYESATVATIISGVVCVKETVLQLSEI